MLMIVNLSCRTRVTSILPAARAHEQPLLMFKTNISWRIAGGADAHLADSRWIPGEAEARCEPGEISVGVRSRYSGVSGKQQSGRRIGV
jgi:hypothetical protein